MIRVGVLGAAGRMGREIVRAVDGADDLELVAAVDPGHAGDTVGAVAVTADTDALDVGDVAVDFTRPDAVLANARACLRSGVHVVIGTTGIEPGGLEELRALAEAGDANAIVAPNFALGAALLQRFAADAARHFAAAEVVELHHDGKRDAPSGTAIAIARAIAAAREGASPSILGEDAFPGARGGDVDGVRVHSLRLPGALAHHEAIFGGPGQTLTIRHDTTDRACYLPGVLLAIRAVAERPGLTVGLDRLLG
ncbi:MAG TPA: 4-hydroxy-tetrahydrodipicolinate reductase [Actinomycetota bacterium]|nr:4-hydroxy-tetrahydrodipicolinate reductase [Actinomycetota bacterium]